MKKSALILVFFTASIISFILFANFQFKKDKTEKDNTSLSRSIVLQFVTYNGYGNNLYLDNILTGKQQESDVVVTSITNISYDTSYSVRTTGTDTINPVISFSNIGRTAADSFYVHLEINSGLYTDSFKVNYLNSGQTLTDTLKKLTYVIGSPLYFKSYSSYRLDSNRTNDTLRQYSIFLPGYKRNVLLEEFTSNASFACANNNPALNAFVDSNFQNITAIKYHLPIGTATSDIFYFSNPLQNDQRSRYYYLPSFPTTIFDGKLFGIIPYGDSANLYKPYFLRLNKGTPVSVNVTDELIGTDSIKATITVNIASAVPPGDYRLRINAIQRYAFVDTTLNNEHSFYDTFRRFYPDSSGISIPVSPGKYSYSYTYFIEPVWDDTLMYTSAFIQNDNTREVLNSAKGRNIILKNVKNDSKINVRKETSKNSIINSFGKREVLFNSDSISTQLNIELFEGFFPPAGWRILNEDGYITFNKYPGVNGPSIGGTNSVIMDFFGYNIPGKRDTMISKIYEGLLNSDTIRFDYAYALYSTLSNADSLTVKISTDGGLTFPAEIFRKGGSSLATAPQTTSFFIPSNNTQWKTFKYALSGVVGINNYSDMLPENFTLHQNYPNPFNPVTKINYELRITNYVSLKVYNALGKEVANLVNEIQSAGSHVVEFNGSNLASGIYFYQLTATGFTDTKRMVLIK